MERRFGRGGDSSAATGGEGGPDWHAVPVDDAAADASDKPALLISACLLGVACNHEGRGSPRAVVDELARRYRLVPVCPEVLGGLPTPRAAAELTGGDGADVIAGAEGARVVNVEGDDVTAAYRRGAEAAVTLARAVGATRAVLKARSPSCGSSAVYDGTFSRRLVPGPGVTAAALAAAGLEVGSEEDAAAAEPPTEENAAPTG
ncbi:MAG: hypothetical protein QOD57_1997 [Actinomycetota bacterium]|nr:hypothetical protein [Actinomycetota bacterium]